MPDASVKVLHLLPVAVDALVCPGPRKKMNPVWSRSRGASLALNLHALKT